MKKNPKQFTVFSSLTSSAGSSVSGAELGHLPDNITVLEGDSVTLRSVLVLRLCRSDEENPTSQMSLKDPCGPKCHLCCSVGVMNATMSESL